MHRETKLRLVEGPAATSAPAVEEAESGDATPRRRSTDVAESPRRRGGEARRSVVVVSDVAATRRWSRRWLQQNGFEVIVVADAVSAIESVRVARPSVILTEAGLAIDGIALTEAVRELPSGEDLPVVTICGRSGEIERALEAGTTEVVRKPLNWRLVSQRIELLARMYGSFGELGRTRQRLERAERSVDEAQQRLRHLTTVDHLTELPTRSHFERLIDRALATSGAQSEVAVLYLDLDRFKAINEIVGREEGDRILRKVAERLQGCLRRSDLLVRSNPGVGTAAVARLSGDEFTILLTHVAGQSEVLQAAQGLLVALSAPFSVEQREVFLSATVGIALSRKREESGEVLLQHAEVAMCEAKRQGGGMVRSYEHSMESFNQRSADLHGMLREAHDAGDLALHYQPLVDTGSGRVVAAEALLRWQHCEMGSISPADFLPAAEGTDLMLAIGEWVLRSACGQLAEWLAAGLPRIRMAVNIASCQLRRSDLAGLVSDVLRTTGVAPELLELELSEKGVLRQDGMVLQQLHQLKRLGVRLSADDFGTGHSAIGYLKRFPLDVLKIDRSYVAGLANNASDAGIASAMVTMAHSLDLSVVAEGVEEDDQLALLSEWGCDELQGFLFSPAVRAAEFRQILENGFGGALLPPATGERAVARTDEGRSRAVESTPAIDVEPGDGV